MDWSDYQKNIFEWVESGEGNAIVTAVAGSGKTTTLVEAAKRANAKGLFLAFNKSVADELSRRLPAGFEARTLNSLGHRILMARLAGRPRLDPAKTFGILKKHRLGVGMEGAVARMVSLCKAHGLSPTNFPAPMTTDALSDILSRYDIQVREETVERFFRDVREALVKSLEETAIIDYDDQQWMPVVMHLTLPGRPYPWIMVDEAQDLSLIQRHLLSGLNANRLIAVGDPGQAIYGFRGAGYDSMERIQGDFKCTPLPLTITYRCARTIVDEAARWRKGIEAAEDAQDGQVIEQNGVHDISNWVDDAREQTLVICRRVAPLVAAAQDLWLDGRPCWLDARDHCRRVKALIQRAGGSSRDVLLLAEEGIKLAAELAERFDNDSILTDAEDVATTCGLLARDVRTSDGMLARAEALFEPTLDDKESADIRLTSVHRAKGGEANQVVWLSPPDDPDDVRGQERNICYVAATRAKTRLVKLTKEGDDA